MWRRRGRANALEHLLAWMELVSAARSGHDRGGGVPPPVAGGAAACPRPSPNPTTVHPRSLFRLEAAEAAMAAARLQGERVNPKLAAALQASGSAAGAEAGPREAGAGDKEDDGADSDEEWRAIKARAASRAATEPASRECVCVDGRRGWWGAAWSAVEEGFGRAA